MRQNNHYDKTNQKTYNLLSHKVSGRTISLQSCVTGCRINHQYAKQTQGYGYA